MWLSASIARAWSRVRLGQLDTVPGLLEELRPYAGRVVLTGQLPPALGSADYFLGLMERALDRPEAARTYLASAVHQNERLGARAWLARALHALADVVGPDGEGPDGATADGLRARARQVADQVDNPLLAAEMQR